ncbi:MAG: hypothetical protein KF884_07220 [Fimbriimonadaceae bacterium]|nr:hypothetical protein [Fimbriimonadaceae bacterium]QYK57340.1 MAG: hypothetical protein KF884_07220 [Fimbriimonadaceae bacterium]
MQRREFLKGVAVLGTGLVWPGMAAWGAAPAKRARTVRTADDRFEIVSPNRGRFRILQVTDTHFGRPNEADAEKDKRTAATLRALIEEHEPDLDFHTMRQAGGTVGRKGEDVCYETDTGEVFRRYRDSGRVRAVLCGHDHVNDYLGDHQGVHLIYGRVSGWAGYGDWQRGGRLLDCDLDQGRFSTRVVLPAGQRDNAYFSKTLEDSRFPTQKEGL